MPRRNHNQNRTPQKARGLKRPRGWHRKQISPGTRQAGEFLDRWRNHGGEKAA